MTATITAKQEVATVKVMKTADITIPDRFRKENGNLEALAASILANRLVHFPVVNEKGELLAGARRFLALRDVLLYKEIPVRVIEGADALAIEHDENEMRKDFTISERVAMATEMQKRLGDGRTDKDNVSRVEGERRALAAENAGFDSAATLSRARKVVKQGAKALVEAMDAEDIPVTAAAKIADLPKGQQSEVVKKMKEGKGFVTAMSEVTGHQQEGNGDAHEGTVAEEQEAKETNVDALGKKVPYNLRDVFNSTMLADCARGIGILLKQLHSVNTWNPYLPLADIQSHLKLARDLINTAQPRCVCVRCKGVMNKTEACESCRKKGWMTENALAEAQNQK